MNERGKDVIDMHVHVGLRGDTWPKLGRFSDRMMGSATARVLLLYSGMTWDDLTDERMKAATLKTIGEMQVVDRVVCLAMDPAYDERGNRLENRSHMWVANEYVVQLQRELPDKVLFGASVHPYDPTFKDRVRKCVDDGAVLLKWLPSAQGINLADERVGDALRFLATARGEKPLPVLIHVGPEHSIPPVNRRMKSYDFLSWGRGDRFQNWLHWWYWPDVPRIHRNLRAGLHAGAVIIFAHCGLPYFGWRRLSKRFKHSDLEAVSMYLKDPDYRGQVFADVSAILTPVRHSYFTQLGNLPPGSLLLGSDFPVPIFPLPMDPEQDWREVEDVLEGRAGDIVPKGNLIDVNYGELQEVFGQGLPRFTNFAALI